MRLAKLAAIAAALLPLLATAGTVTLNGMSCGSLQNLSVSSAGNVTVSTDVGCGGAVIPPPEPPDTPGSPTIDPFACVRTPALDCASRPFPIIVQEIVSLYGSRTVAIKVRVPASGRGYVQTMQYAGVTAARTVTLSTLPGVMTAPRECVKWGFEVTGNAWTTTPGVRGECLLPAGKDVYINIQASNCPAGTRCKIYMRAE